MSEKVMKFGFFNHPDFRFNKNNDPYEFNSASGNSQNNNPRRKSPRTTTAVNYAQTRPNKRTTKQIERSTPTNTNLSISAMCSKDLQDNFHNDEQNKSKNVAKEYVDTNSVF